MKITKSKLKRIITEELQNILSEVDPTKVLDPVEMAKKRQADREARHAELIAKAKVFGRGDRLMKALYPDTTREEVLGITREPDEEGKLAEKLFSFLFSGAELRAGISPDLNLLKIVEDWVESKGAENASLRRKSEEGRDELNKDNFDDLQRAIDAPNWATAARTAKAGVVPPDAFERDVRRHAAKEIIKMINKAGGVLNPATGELQTLPDLDDKETYSSGEEEEYIERLKKMQPTQFRNFSRQWRKTHSRQSLTRRSQPAMVYVEVEQ